MFEAIIPLRSKSRGLINKNILGGWKYINEKTGQFFTDENDVGKNIEIMMNKLKNNEYEPRKFFIDNYGAIKSGKKLVYLNSSKIYFGLIMKLSLLAKLSKYRKS